MGGNLSVEEIEQFVALDEKQLKFDVRSDDHVTQIVKHLLSDPSDRSADLLKMLKLVDYKLSLPQGEIGDYTYWSRECRNKFVKKIYKFCVKTNQERYISTILKTNFFACRFITICWENLSRNTFSAKVFEISNLRQLNFDAFGKSEWGGLESEITEHIARVFDENFDAEIAKKIISTATKCEQDLTFLLTTEKNIRVVTGLDPVWFAKFVDLGFYDKIVELVREKPDVLGMHKSPYGEVDWDGYVRASNFCTKFSGRSFTKITVEVRNALQELGVVGKTELLRILVWSKVHTHYITPEQIYVLIERLLTDGIFVPFMLHQFVKKKQYNLVKLYLDYGGDISGRDNSGKCAYEYADGKMSEQLYLRLVPRQKCASFIDDTSDATSAGSMTFHTEDD